MALGEYLEGKDWPRRAFDENPRAQDVAVDLVLAAMDRQDYRTAQETLDKIKERFGPTEAWADLQTRLMEERGESPDLLLRNLARLHPCAIGPRLVLARRMLRAGVERVATPHLEVLDGLGSAEAAYFRGVTATRQGDFAQALVHMERALYLNPDHGPTRQQVEALRVAAQIS